MPLLGLLRHSVPTDDDGVVPLVGLQRELLGWLEVLLLKLLHLSRENSLSGHRGINTVGLDTDNKVALVLQKVVRVLSIPLNMEEYLVMARVGVFPSEG